MHHRYGNLAMNDGGLTAAGWEQASALAEWLRTHEKIDVLVSSEQLRSRLTTQRIGQVLSLPITIEPDIPQAPDPDWTLHPPHARMEEESTAAPEANPGTDNNTDPLAGLSPSQRYIAYQQALVEALEHILEKQWGKTIAIVTHSSAIATLLRYFSGGQKLGIQIENTSISELIYAEQRWTFAYVNRREHLPRPPLPPSKVAPEPVSAAEAGEELRTARQVYNRVAATYGTDDHKGESQAVQELLTFAELPEALRVLDVGSGPGHISLALAQAGAREVVGVDISPAMLEQAEYLRLSTREADIVNRINFRLASARHLPFRAERFDAAVCRFLLHHLREPELVLQEINRVLKGDGILVVVEIVGSNDAVKRATQNAIETRRNPSHTAVYSTEQYQKMLSTSGFMVEKQKEVTVEHTVDEWLDSVAADDSTLEAVQEMLEASLETDAAGLNVRKQDETLVFERKSIYLRARKTKS